MIRRSVGAGAACFAVGQRESGWQVASGRGRGGVIRWDLGIGAAWRNATGWEDDKAAGGVLRGGRAH